MINVIFIQSIFAILYLLMKKAVLSFYKYDSESWERMKCPYYWLEYVFIFTATILTPKHTANEGIITLASVIMIKVFMDNLTVIDKMFDSFFHKHKK